MCAARCVKPGAVTDAASLLVGLLDMVIDRVADTLERLSIEMDALSETVFRPTNPADRRRTVEYQDVLREIGRKGELNAKIQESLLCIGRVAGYLEQALRAGRQARGRARRGH